MRTLFVDWSNLLYRCLFVAYKDNPFDDKFELTKRMVFNSLLELVKKFSPTELIICGDGKNPWRKEIYPDYKKGRRADSPIDFDAFFSVMNSYWDSLSSVLASARWLRFDDVEADDIVAILTKGRMGDIVCVSSDGDYVQLLSNRNFRIWNPTRKEFTESLNPSLALELKVVCGDKSDNISGIKFRLGPKTAEKMITENRLLKLLETDPEANENYIRNRRLIDMKNIPARIEEKVLKGYEEKKSGKLDKKNLYGLVFAQVPNQLENIAEIDYIFSNLEGEPE